MNFYKKFKCPSLFAPNLKSLFTLEAKNAQILKNNLIYSLFQCGTMLHKPAPNFQQTNWIYRLVDLKRFERFAAALWLAIQTFQILITSLKYLAPEYFKVFKHLMSNNLEG